MKKKTYKKRELCATDCEYFKTNFSRSIGRRVLAVKCSKNDHKNLEECTTPLTRMMDLMPSDFTTVYSTLPATLFSFPVSGARRISVVRKSVSRRKQARWNDEQAQQSG